MATLEQVKRMIKEQSTLDLAKENLDYEKKEKEMKEKIKKEMQSLGIGF